MMKSITLLAIVAATLLAPPLWAADGTMKFSGKLTENACVLDAGSQNMTVNMGRIPILGDNRASGSGYFTIQINDCPASSNQAQVQFEGTPVAGATGYNADQLFASSNAGQPGAAGNIAFKISGIDLNFITVNGKSKTYDLVTGAGSVNELPFYAWYTKIKNGDEMTVGTLVGNVQFSIIYP